MRPALVLALIVLNLASAPLLAEPADSVVKVTAFTRFPDPTRPWEKGKSQEGTGSGAYIGNNRIVTNAHVVNYASEVYVQWNQAGERVDAKIEAISVDLDLALLSVADDKFFAKRKPLSLAKGLPKVKDSVTTYGYPRGGTGLSVTKGEVSRINSISYGTEGFGMQIQISAAVNRGNSGGPAIVGDQVIGLVYSTLFDAQNINYVIPAEEVQFFVTHSKDGRFTGKPRVNTQSRYQTLENDSLRKAFGIDRNVQGVLIYSAAADVPLKENDILTKIGEYPIDNRGYVQLNPETSVFFMSLVPKVTDGKTAPVTVIRNGKTMTIKVPVRFDDPYVIPRYRGEPLSYFIHGPLVFVPARSEDVSDYYARLNPFLSESPLSRRRNDYARFAGEEFVVISAQFRHKTTKGYVEHTGEVVRAVNGTPVKNLRHLVEVLRDSRDEFLKFEFAEKSAGIMIFDRVAMDEATEQIIEEIGIAVTRRGSPDLMKAWRAKK